MNAILRTTFLASALALASNATAQIVNTIVNNGPTANRYDMVILGDGYRAVEQTKFNNDCLRFANDLFRKEPYTTYAGYVNIHTVFRASNESGADHPDANPPIYRDTAYDASYNTGGTPRCLYIRNSSLALSDAALAPANEGRILVMVNDTRYGGCAGTFAVSYTGSQMSEVQTHEIGHSIGGLADEYDYPNDLYTGPEPSQVNVTTSPVGAKWSRWHGTDGISAFEGARYYRRGLWRPRSNCLMRALGQPNCRVCAEALVLKLNQHASAIDNPQPSSNTVNILAPATQRFSFTNIAPSSSNTLVTWELDGNVVAMGTTTYLFDSSTVSPGRHTLQLRVLDRTAWVRRDISGHLDHQRQWTIDVQGPPQPDLSHALLQVSSTTIQAGSAIDISGITGNLGNTSAPPHRVDHFLSPDTTITAADTYLGGYDAPALGVNQFHTASRTGVRIPAFVTPGTYYVGAWIDRTNLIVESDESNNIRVVRVTVTRAACTPVLEFNDRLLYPTNDAAISASTTGSAAHPTVISPCDSGSLYAIVWGRSGTSPGTVLGPGLTLPLNLDLYSELSLIAANSPYFIAFQGILDSDGIGAATFHLQGLPVSRTLPGHFAAVIIDSTGSTFTGVTNAVGITVNP